MPKQAEKEPEETTDIIEALKASLQVKGKSSKSTAAKAKGKQVVWNHLLLCTQEKSSKDYLRL